MTALGLRWGARAAAALAAVFGASALSLHAGNDAAAAETAGDGLSPGEGLSPPASRSPEVAGTLYDAAGGARAGFFGASGELYDAEGLRPPRYVRRAAGGVAARVRGAVSAEGDLVFAVGDRTPLFRREGGVWYTHELPDHGRAALATGGSTTALAVGEVLYALRGGDWRRIGRGPGAARALWVGDDDRYYVATRDGDLYQGREGSFREIDHPLDEDDPISALLGVPGEALFAVAESGAVLRVGPRRAREITVPPGVAVEDAEATGYLADGTPALVAPADATASERAAVDDGAGGDGGADSGERARGAGTPRVIVALRGDRGRVAAELPALAEGDRWVAFAAARGATAIASRGGRVAADPEGAWIVGEVDPEPRRAPEPPANAPAPARRP